MLKYFQYNKKFSKKKLKNFLEKRKLNKKNKNLKIKKNFQKLKLNHL